MLHAHTDRTGLYLCRSALVFDAVFCVCQCRKGSTAILSMLGYSNSPNILMCDRAVVYCQFVASAERCVPKRWEVEASQCQSTSLVTISAAACSKGCNYCAATELEVHGTHLAAGCSRSHHCLPN